MSRFHGHDDEREEIHLEREEVHLLRKILGQLEKQDRPRLSVIKIAIGGRMPVGPATLTVGQTATATVQGFDQNGAPFAIDFAANPVTWTDSAEAVVSDVPTAASDPLTAVAVGTASITAVCAGLTDTETVTVIAQAPVLTSIKVSID